MLNLFHFHHLLSWEKKIPLVRGGLEKTWLFHEIGWCYLELNRHEEAREYGVRSAAAADEIADEKWQINSNVLVAQSECNLTFHDFILLVFTNLLIVACHLVWVILKVNPFWFHFSETWKL